VEAILQRTDADEGSNPFELPGDTRLPPPLTPSTVSGPEPVDLDPQGGRPAVAAVGDDGSAGPATPRLLLAPLALSSPGGPPLLGGESSAALLLAGARQAAAQLPPSTANATTAETPAFITSSPLPDGDEEGKRSTAETACLEHTLTAAGDDVAGRRKGRGGEEVARNGGKVSVMQGVELALGLALHSRALLRAQQAAVAGMALAEIDAHLERLAAGHQWTAEGQLADFAALRAAPGMVQQHSSVGGGGEEESEVAASRRRTNDSTARVGGGGPVRVGGAGGGGGGSNGGVGVTASAPSVRSGSTATHVSKRRDYLREDREARELVQR
jgi:hypothetical protein